MLNRAVWVEEAINTSSNVCSISRHSVRQSAELHVRDQPCLQHTSPSSSSSSSPSPSPSAAAFTTLKSSTFYHQNNITYSTQHKKCTKHHNSERWYSQQFVKQRYLNNVNLTRHASHHHHFSSNFTASCTFMSSDRTVTHHLILGHLISFCYILVPETREPQELATGRLTSQWHASASTESAPATADCTTGPSPLCWSSWICSGQGRRQHWTD